MSNDGKLEGSEPHKSVEFAGVIFTQKSAYNEVLRKMARDGKLNNDDGTFFYSAQKNSVTVCLGGEWYAKEATELHGVLSHENFIEIPTPYL